MALKLESLKLLSLFLMVLKFLEFCFQANTYIVLKLFLVVALKLSSLLSQSLFVLLSSFSCVDSELGAMRILSL